MIKLRKPSSYGLLDEDDPKSHEASFSFQNDVVENLEKFFSGHYSSKEVGIQNDWEYAIIFQNPDKDPRSNGIIYKEAYEIFHKSCVNYPLEYEKAFEKVFNDLTEAHCGKIIDGGGRLQKCGDNGFMDTGKTCADFLTLLRNVAQYILECVLHFKTMLVLSSDGNHIYLLLSSNIEFMLEEAENTEYNLQMKVSVVDSMSLEPCDKNLRPLRFLKTKNEKVKKLLEELTAIESINWSSEHYQKYVPRGISSEHWEAYAEYLELLLNDVDKGEDYLKLTERCKSTVNRRRNKKYALKNLWDWMEFLKPTGPYCDFSSAYPENVWKRYKSYNTLESSLLRNVDILKMIPSYIGRKLDLHYLKSKKIVKEFYPLHNFYELNGKINKSEVSMFQDYCEGVKIKKKDLIFKWNNRFFDTNLPLGKIRKYYGEKIGLYFAFVSLYGNFLAVPSIVGIGVFIIQRMYTPYFYIVIILNTFYSIYMTTIAITLLEVWKRKQSSLAIEWGQTDFEEDEVPRPQFKGKLRRSPINDDLEEIYYPQNKRRVFYVIGMLVTCFILLLVLSTLSGILILRRQLANHLMVYGIDFSGILCSIMNAVQIQVFNFIFEKVVIKLNRMENHRTQSEYDDSLIVKTYLFQFANSFSSLYYIAFIKTHWEGCLVSDGNSKKLVLGANCMDELYIQLLSLFVTLFLKNIVEILGPVISYKLKERKMKEVFSGDYLEKLREELDKQFYLNSYDSRESDGTLEDFMELAIMFGYITLFAVAFPLSSFLTYLAILIEIQVDRFKLIYLVRRPHPLGSKTIGVWQGIFSFNCTAAIFTNVGIICFTIPALENWKLAADNLYLSYTLSVLVLIGFQWLLQFSIPDISAKYTNLLKRHQNIIEKKLVAGSAARIPEIKESIPNFNVITAGLDQPTTVSL